MQAVIRKRRETGIIVVMALLSMFVLLAFVGIALDASFLYFQKRRMQTAADAAAYAGALEKMRGNDSTAATNAARNDSSVNGFTNGTDGVTVAVNIPPTSGSHTGSSNFVEVIIQQPQPTWFMRAVNFSSANVAARAVAGLSSVGNGCVYSLNPVSGSNNGFFTNGTTNSSFSCGVFSNSDFRATGQGCVSTPSVSYVGTYDNHNGTAGCGPTGVGQGVAIANPLKGKYSIPAPTTPCDTHFGSTGSTRINNDSNAVTVDGVLTTTLSPGVYCGGIDIGGSATKVVFQPGNYILMGGGLGITSSTAVEGTGVTFWNTYDASNSYGKISINGSGTTRFSAPTTTGSDSAGRALSKGLLFWQDERVAWAANNGSTIAGGANSVYEGIIYFPTTDLTYSGNSCSAPGGTQGYTVLIGWNIKINGTAQINSDYSSIGGSNPIQVAVFAE